MIINMRNLSLNILAVLMLSGCEPDTVKTKYTGEYINGSQVRIIEFEGCEYVKFGGGDVAWGSHKGNCKNHKK